MPVGAEGDALLRRAVTLGGIVASPILSETTWRPHSHAGHISLRPWCNHVPWLYFLPARSPLSPVIAPLMCRAGLPTALLLCSPGLRVHEIIGAADIGLYDCKRDA